MKLGVGGVLLSFWRFRRQGLTYMNVFRTLCCRTLLTAQDPLTLTQAAHNKRPGQLLSRYRQVDDPTESQ